MNIQVKKLEKGEVEITGEMPWEDFNYYRAEAIENLNAGLKIDGFRPGKAPKKVIEEKAGKEDVLFSAANLAFKDKYSEILKSNQLKPITAPEIAVLKLAHNNPFCFKIKVFVLPEIKLFDLANTAKQVQKKVEAVEEKEVEGALNWVLKSRADFKDLAREACLGDFIEVEYQSPQIEDNKLFEDKFLLGQGKLVKGFEDNLLSMKEGEEKKFECLFPDDFANKGLAGKKVEFKVKMKKVKEMVLPHLNDDFAKGLGDFKDLLDLKSKIKEGITQEKEIASKIKWRDEVLSNIAKQVDFVIPEILLKSETERMIQHEEHTKRKEFSLEEKEELKTKFSTEAKDRVKKALCLGQIAKEKSVSVSDEELEQEVNKYLTNYPQDKIKEIDLDKFKEYYKERIIEEKTFQFLENLCQ
ncbi:trigger factor [Candidatus Parcubacteria bacterium]|nr:trigger factor [Candidatus Parcubacteria bacterium]